VLPGHVNPDLDLIGPCQVQQDAAEILAALPRVTYVPVTRLDGPFEHPDWLFELKYDGFATLRSYLRGKTRRFPAFRMGTF
jgi:hypothetical protein